MTESGIWAAGKYSRALSRPAKGQEPLATLPSSKWILKNCLWRSPIAESLALPAFLLAAAFAWATLPAHAAGPVLGIRPAEVTAYAEQAPMMAVVHAGARLVAVGANGVVLLSDDDGVHYRQARQVPVDATLTAVSFADPDHGWAVGNWGIILCTEDAGETWKLQRSDLSGDIPLFGVHAIGPQSAWAVGLWSLMLRTEDAGATWDVVKPPPEHGADKTGLNFYDVFPVAPGVLMIAAEQGKLLRSADDGASWSVIDTGYAGSFWSGLTLADGTVLVGGLRGNIYRSTDKGLTWIHARTDGSSSVTDLAQLPDGSIVGSALDGVVLHSTDNGVSFSQVQRPDRAELTAVVAGSGHDVVLMSRSGVLPPQLPAGPS